MILSSTRQVLTYASLLLTLILSIIVSTNSYAKSLYQQSYQQQSVTRLSVKELEQITEQLANAKEIKQTANLDIEPFHLRAEPHQKPSFELNQSLCHQCHNARPHQKSAKTRSFLNMHAQQMDCLSCHFSTKEKQLNYQWLDSNNKLIKSIDFTDKARYQLVATYQSKSINPSYQSNFAKEIKSQWQKLDDLHHSNKKQKALLWRNLHQPLAQETLTCTSCHQQKSPRLNITALGADENQKRLFEQNTIARFFQRYKKPNDKIKLIEILK